MEPFAAVVRMEYAGLAGTLGFSNVAAGKSSDGSNYTLLASGDEYQNERCLKFHDFGLTEGVTAPANSLLVCAAYGENNKMVSAQTAEIKTGCFEADAATLVSIPTSGVYKLFLLAKGTYAPLCAAWDSTTSPG